MNFQNLYVFIIGSMLSILLILTDSAFMPIEESSSPISKTIVSEVSAEKDNDLKLLTINFKINTDNKLLNSHLYLQTFTSYAYSSELFRPPISLFFYSHS